MKRSIIAVLSLLALPLAAQASLFTEDPVPAISGLGASFDTAFSTSEDVTLPVVKAIGNAQKSIRVSAREFISKPVAEALFRAARAKKDVKIVLDKKSNVATGYTAALFLQTMGYPPHVTKNMDTLYANYIVIDDSDVIVGNIGAITDVDMGKKNPASVLVIHNAPELAKKYLANWQALWDASEEMKKEK